MNENDGNESFYRDTDEDMGTESYQLEDPMTFWDAEKKTLWKKIWGRSETPFVLMGIGLVLVVVLFFAFFPREGGSDAPLDGAGLSARLQQIEDKIGRMEAALEGIATLQEDMEPMKKAILRFDSTDASMSTRIQSLADGLVSLQTEMEDVKKSLSIGSKTSAAAPRTENAPAASQAVYHEVVKGDTLYSIGRRYGVSVDVIQKLNGLSGQDAIHPGQKLKVKE